MMIVKYSLHSLDRQLSRRDIIAERVLVHVQGRQSQRHVRLQLGREPLLRYVVAALQVQVVHGVEVLLRQLGGRCGHEGHAEQAAQLVGAGSCGYLEWYEF